MEQILFEQDQRTKEITLPTLRSTVSLSEFTGKLPKTRPIEHYQLIDEICNAVTAKNHIFELDPIFVSKSESKRIMKLDPDNLGLADSYLFQRLVTRAKISSLAVDEQHQPTIAIGYNEKGIQLAVGVNVTICQNMCIFAKRLMTTYGNNKMPFDKMMEIIHKYIGELPEIHEKDMRILNSMNDIAISQNDIIKNVGELQIKAVESAYFGKESPFNISQVSSFSQGIIQDHPDVLELANVEEDKIINPISLYDFFNRGTRILHPKRSDISTLWEDVEKWSDFITNKYDLN